MELFPEMKAFLDATEQEILRPQNKKRRRNYYSGKKKKHTVKTWIMVTKKGLILNKTNIGTVRNMIIMCLRKKIHHQPPPDVEIGVSLGISELKKRLP